MSPNTLASLTIDASESVGGMQVVFTGWIDSLQRMNLEGRLREAIKYCLADFSIKGGVGYPLKSAKSFPRNILSPKGWGGVGWGDMNGSVELD